MKKNLFFISVAVLALSSCNNDTVVDENLSANQPKEITFQAITTPTTRAAVDGTDFPTDVDMKVAAYQVEAEGGTAGEYFGATTFSKGTTYWGATPAKFWPLTAAYINFLAIANANADNATGVTWTYPTDGKVAIVMSDNSSAQRDLMYAIGSGAVTQSTNALSFPAKIDMEFKHAQAWVDFKVKAKTDAETAITINSITLNGAVYEGKFTVTHTGYNANSSSSQSVAGAWTDLGTAKPLAVPGWTAAALTTDFVTVANGLMIVPDDAVTSDMTGFTIDYTFDGKNYTYTYSDAKSVDQAKHYIYEITFELHEVLVNPTVEDWADQSASSITVGD
jgi:hypothetical protein